MNELFLQRNISPGRYRIPSRWRNAKISRWMLHVCVRNPGLESSGHDPWDRWSLAIQVDPRISTLRQYSISFLLSCFRCHSDFFDFFFPLLFSKNAWNKNLGVSLAPFDFIFITFTQSRLDHTGVDESKRWHQIFFFLVLDDNKGKKIVINPTSRLCPDCTCRLVHRWRNVIWFYWWGTIPLVSWLLSVGSFMSLEYFSRLKSLITRIYLVNECKSWRYWE